MIKKRDLNLLTVAYYVYINKKLKRIKDRILNCIRQNNNEMEFYRCNCCEIEKNETEFQKDASRKSGKKSTCTVCSKFNRFLNTSKNRYPDIFIGEFFAGIDKYYIAEDDNTKRCTKCNEIKNLNLYNSDKYKYKGVKSQCISCNKKKADENKKKEIDTDAAKTCNKCKIEKNVTEFYADPNCKLGVKPQCKLCCEEIKKQYREGNKDSIIEKNKIYRDKPENNKRVKIVKMMYRKNNAEEIKEYNKIYRKINIDKIREKDKEYRKNNKDKIREKNILYRQSSILKFKQKRRLNKKPILEKPNKIIIKKKKFMTKKRKTSKKTIHDKNIVSKSSSYDYEKICNIFKIEKCTLMTSNDEYLILVKGKSLSYCKFNFIASCGHENTVTFTNFISKKSGVICKKCMYLRVRERLRIRHQKFDNNENQIIEYKSYLFIKNILVNDFDINKTNEGCLSDMIIKPINNSNDKWLKIQLKTTENICHNLYSFGTRQKYIDCIMICICRKDNKIWVFDYKLISHLKSKLNIGSTKSKYNKYLVNSIELIKSLSNYYNDFNKFTLKECLNPTSIFQQQEQFYRSLREKKISFVEFLYPEIEASKFDFKINNLKFQEKVSSIRKDNKDGYIFNICCNNGRNDEKQRLFRYYIIGENDFYWLWIKNTEIFYLIPEKILIYHGIIKKKIEIGKSIISLFPFLKKSKLNFVKTKWANSFIFDLNNFDKKKFLQLINVIVV